MRLIAQAAALMLLAVPAFAQTPATAPTTPAPAGVARPQPPRIPLAQRFAEANTSKDGAPHQGSGGG